MAGNRQSPEVRWFSETEGSGRTTQQPPRTHQQVHGIPEKGRAIPLDGVADQLQNPTDYEQRERPTPIEKKQRQRDRDHGYADAVHQLIERMLVFGFVVIDKRLGHLIDSTSSSS